MTPWWHLQQQREQQQQQHDGVVGDTTGTHVSKLLLAQAT
jgi:hypothetical protein